VRWGDRATPLAVSDAELPPAKQTALAMVNQIRARKAGARERSHSGLQSPNFVGS